MKVASITNGIVIDHITAGRGMQLYELLGLDAPDVSVAIIRNVVSHRMGRKDMIKIDADIAVNFDVIGFVDPAATVNIIRGGELVEKRRPDMPRVLTNVIRCRNPRCITGCEQELDSVFYLADGERRLYRCRYCETEA